MPVIIRNKDAGLGYYTGQGWSTDKSQAKQFAEGVLAIKTIVDHNMRAEPEEVGGTGNQSGGGSIDR